MKISQFFINAIYWITIFLVPAGTFGFIGLWYYVKSRDNLVLSIIIGTIGLLLGVILAEGIRRKYGLDNFFGRRLATPDIDGGNILDEKEKKVKLEQK